MAKQGVLPCEILFIKQPSVPEKDHSKRISIYGGPQEPRLSNHSNNAQVETLNGQRRSNPKPVEQAAKSPSLHN